MKKLFACVLAAAVLGASAHAQSVQPIDGIAVVVDEDVILDSELALAVGNIQSQYAGREDQLPPADVLERQVAERLVLVKLQAARAEGTGVRVSDQQVDQAIAGITAQNGLTVDQMRQQLSRDGSSFEQFRGSVRDELLIQQLRQRFAQSEIAVSESEVDAALAAQSAAGPQFHLAHILVALPEGATPEQIATAQKKIDGVKGLIDRGELDFAAAAARYSDSPNALEGGDLGWRDANEIPGAFADLMRTLQPGQVTDPLRGASGFQLLKLVETRDATDAEPAVVTQYHARHILIRVDDNTTAEQAKAQIDTLRARIAGGADFAEIALEKSEDENSQGRGGDLGWFTVDQFGPDFGNQIASLSDGEVSAPFRTQTGWHVAERLESRQGQAGDENRRAQVRETIGRRKLEDQWGRFLREMRGEAFVDFRTGAPDASGQSPATATPPAPGADDKQG